MQQTRATQTSQNKKQQKNPKTSKKFRPEFGDN